VPAKKKTLFDVLDDVIEAIKGNHSPHSEILREITELKAGQVRIEEALVRIEEGLGKPPEEEAVRLDIVEGQPEEQPI
jgi:hypothetical protein